MIPDVIPDVDMILPGVTPLAEPPALEAREGPLEISGDERAIRIGALQEFLVQRGHAAAVLFDRIHIIYLTGYHFQQTERPVALVVTAEGRTGLLTPALEAEHAAHSTAVDAAVDIVQAYPEYPGLRHPMLYLVDLLERVGVGAETFSSASTRMGVNEIRLAADLAGYPPVWGYQGPDLADVTRLPVVRDVQGFLAHHRSIKRAEVIGLIRLSAYWGNLAHELLHAAIQPGANEVAIGQAASHAATAQLFEAMGDRYRNHDWGVTPIHVGLKAGKDTATPHPMGGSRPMAAGDLMITWATAKMAGYHAELERTLVLGAPTAEQSEFFQHMCRAQAIGVRALQAGLRCSDVDEAVYAYWESHDLLPYVRHHTGHGLDMEIHAPPFLDRGDRTLLEPGMLFSVEPGLYVPGVGGFRHSDTVLVTESGPEVLTWYPRDLAALTIAVPPEPSPAVSQLSSSQAGLSQAGLSQTGSSQAAATGPASPRSTG